MNKKYIFKSILILVFFAAILGAGYYFLFSKQDNAGNTVVSGVFGWKYPVTKFPLVGPTTSNQIAYSNIRDPGGIPQGLPVRLQIPIIGVDSAIEDALITPDGRMDVPAGSLNVAWFALGPHPGAVGSAVIGGHFGIEKGVKFVFYDLDKLVVGDKVYILNDKGETLLFQVRSIKSFDRNADATTVFTSTDGLAHLNLITCEGIWNQSNGNYPQRLVVFTDLVQGGAAPISIVTHQTLRIGSHGADVATMQNALVNKGFLKSSIGSTDGIFGNTTRIALSKYQTSIGVSPDGVFGPRTRARLIPPASPVAVIPTLPTTALAPGAISSTISQIMSFFQSLYATPVDGLISSVIFIAIILLFYKIIRLILIV